MLVREILEDIEDNNRLDCLREIATPLENESYD